MPKWEEEECFHKPSLERWCLKSVSSDLEKVGPLVRKVDLSLFVKPDVKTVLKYSVPN